MLVYGETYLGVRHAIETLSQLIVYDEFSNSVLVPNSVSILDAPVYTHRGILLDTSRSFYTTAAIKRVLDGMAYNKLNTFHWHITDSHTFPFASQKYPKMAAYGSYSPLQVHEHIANYSKVRLN